MTAWQSTRLTCDRATGVQRVCGEPFDWPGSPERARRAARDDGWRHTGIGDLCPDHAGRPA